MKVLLVPYDGRGESPTDLDVSKADLVLLELESGDFEAMKWRDGNPNDVKVKVAL